MSTPARRERSERLLIESACLRHALDIHVDQLAEVVGELRQVAGLPEPPDPGDHSDPKDCPDE